LDVEMARVYKKVQPGGYIIFSRNIKSPEQLRKLIDDLRDLSRAEPVITIDQEGGRVSRLREIGQEPPNAQSLRETGDRSLIARHGELTGKLMRLFGFNLDLCPVLDFSTDDNADNSLRGRCYGTTAGQVVDFAGVFNKALRAEGIGSCGKHFPGYSAAGVDPHWEMPVIERSREQLMAEELLPYRQLLTELDSVMSCHAFYPALEERKLPASMSPGILRDLLRDEMGYEGLIMSDDLDMGAILDNFSLEERLTVGLEAGNDLLMICHQLELIEEAGKIMDRQNPALLDGALQQIENLAGTLAEPRPYKQSEFEQLNQDIFQLRVDVLGEERARQGRSPEDGKRSPVELY
jgi:beta-N-acetylhexosaminidase